MFDYIALQGSTENPTLMTIVFTVLLAFLLSSLIVYTYQKTTNFVLTPVAFLQSLILVSIVAAMVMQAIGDSLARGLGMLGALAIIRFRTTLKDPRNMIFTFASLAAGIACGVYGFVIGIVGTIGFCIAAFILKFSPLQLGTGLVGVLTFRVSDQTINTTRLNEILALHCSKFQKVKHEINTKENNKASSGKELNKIVKYEYRVILSKSANLDVLDKDLLRIEGLNAIKFAFIKLEENV